MRRHWKVTAAILLVAGALTASAGAYGSVSRADSYSTISAGAGYSMAVDEDGGLWVWGRNHAGQLGDGTRETRRVPIKIMEDVVSVSAGISHSLAIKSDGTLWAWGDNEYGQLGDGTKEDRYRPVQVMEDVVAASAGNGITMAVKTDHTLWAWGDNRAGYLADGTREERLTPVQILTEVTALTVGPSNNIMVLKEDGSCWVWGGGCMDLVHEKIPDQPTPQKLDEAVVSFSAGEHMQTYTVH